MKALLVALVALALSSCSDKLFYGPMEAGTITIVSKSAFVPGNGWTVDSARVWFESDIPYAGGSAFNSDFWGLVEAGQKIPVTAQRLYIVTSNPMWQERGGSYAVINVRGMQVVLERRVRDEFKYLSQETK